eukprot:1706229-Prymnesium_polylepis.1
MIDSLRKTGSTADHVFVFVPMPNQGGDGSLDTPCRVKTPMPNGWMLPRRELLDAVASRSTPEARSWAR